MKVTYDPEADIIYMVLRDGEVYDSREENEDIRLEYDKEGQLIGIEIMNARANLIAAIAKEISREINNALQTR
ncbi:conserved hypothetical protein [Candidatus Caldarchaeum subterraneum]|uniref:DUF2283 domain-containing protein n=1 Tax=Caldiarchaeum subterraneum TaxID=311458 RepID=E6N4T0_CALS0|nr:conserved hypothetical protein [Candidatus Caldarchaeum subterraneum]BAJ50119.1 conserved hypothetical protein [Candidatus Caldarchaeum subterraneum]